ncbi:hypothetical protein [Streptomyces sp. SID9727]|uniref:hypothetical protein n=1 Tax=Streptomyces sp. SID9727 TaxID=2706114 RepID=UPI0013C9B078|nr:hypothetical protein [Streptomyces sp. SID9727]NEC63841.1 hypothetical protein [Streptomyces sp. SID9727]
MVFVRTTPPRPVDVTAVFPELAPLARAAIRLHPRAGSPSVRDSSVGGPLLWPVEEPWPHCEAAHPGTGRSRSPAEIRLDRRRRARLHHDPRGPQSTPEETAIQHRNDATFMERLEAGPPWPAESPVPMLPVAQLYVRDVPLLRPPGAADMLQVLWCPYDHEPYAKPATALFWRSAADVNDVLTLPPDPYEADWDGYVPEPCQLAPEAITEYPHSLDLSPEMRLMVEDWSRGQAPDVGVDSSNASYATEFYDCNLANAPGWKLGGWPPWGRTDPNPQYCEVCNVQMVPLLTIASFEWNYGKRGWAPYEDAPAAHAAGHRAGQNPAQPTKVEVGSTDNMQLYVCPTSPEHPHTDLIQ